MSIYHEFLSVKNHTCDLDRLFDQVGDVCNDANQSFTKLHNITDIYRDLPVDIDVMRTTTEATGKILLELKSLVNQIMDSVFETCSWVINNAQVPPSDDYINQLSFTLDPDMDFKLYSFEGFKVDDISHFNTQRLNLVRVRKPLPAYSVGEVYKYTTDTWANCQFANLYVFGLNTALRRQFNDSIDMLRKFCTDVAVNTDLLAQYIGRMNNDPMFEDENMDKWYNYHSSPEVVNGLTMFGNVNIWMKNVEDLLVAIENNIAIYSVARDAVEDDKFTM